MQCYRDLTQPQPQNFIKGVRFFHTCIFWAGNLNNHPLFMSSFPPISYVFPVSSCHLISFNHLKIQQIRNIFNFWKMGVFLGNPVGSIFLMIWFMVLLASLEQIREKIKAKQNPQGFLFFSLAPSHLSIMIGYHSDVFVKIYTNKVKKYGRTPRCGRRSVQFHVCQRNLLGALPLASLRQLSLISVANRSCWLPGILSLSQFEYLIVFR